MRLILPLALLCAACGPSGTDPSADNPILGAIYAHYQGSELSVPEVRRRFMSEHSREPDPEDMLRTAKKMAVERTLAADFVGGSLRPDQKDALQVLWIEDAIQLYLKSEKSDALTAKTDEASARRFSKVEPRLSRPERRALYHLYRASQDQDEDVVELLNGLRQRATDGESFQELAKAYSQSENAINGGALGILKRSELPDRIGDILFTMPRQEVSAPVKVRGGYAIFYVEDILSAVQPTRSDYRFPLSIWGRFEAQVQIMRELVSCNASLKLTSTNSRIDQLASMKPDEILIELGPYRMSVLQFNTTLQQHWSTLSQLADPDEWAALYWDYQRWSFCLYDQVVKDWLQDHPVIRDTIQAKEKQRVGTIAYRLGANVFIEKKVTNEALQAFFAEHQVFFQQPMNAVLKMVRVEVNPQRLELVSSPESLFTRPLADVATALGGTVEDLQQVEYPQGIPVKGWQYISRQKGPGRLPLFHFDGWLYVVDVSAFSPPTPRSFNEARNLVKYSYILQNLDALERDFLDEKAKSIGFTRASAL